MKKSLLTFVVALITLFATLPAYAYDDWQEMSPGVPLEYTTAWSPFGGCFTLDSPQTVELTINSNNLYEVVDGFSLYPDASLETPLLNTNREEGAGIYELQAGTYYFYCMSVWGPGSIMYSISSGGVVLNLTDVVPADGSSFGASVNDGFLSIYADFNIYVDSWQLISNRYTSEVKTLDRSKQGMIKSIAIYLKDELKTLHSKGFVEGDSFQIKVSGIEDPNGNQYGDDGTLTLNYKVGKPSLDLASSSLVAGERNRLLNYYLPGDESALVSFTFTDSFDTTHVQEVAPYVNGQESTMYVAGPVLELACIATTAACKHYFVGTFSNDNKTVTFDISGINYGTWDGALGADGAEPGFKVLNIIDMNGERALGSSENTPGAYTFSTDYKQYEQASFEQTWTPAANSKLTDTTQVDIKTILSESDGTGVKNRIRSFGSMTFKAGNGTTEAVPFSDCSMEYINEAQGMLTISCATPQSMKELDNVTVTVAGLVTCDNLIYADGLISADFNPVTIDPSAYVTFGAVDTSSQVTKSAYISSMATINVYTDLIYDGSIPTLTCSDASVQRTIWYVNPNPSTDSDGNNFYSISIGQPIALTAGNGASVVAEGTTLTISFPAKSFSSNLTDAAFDALEYTFTFGPEPVIAEDFTIALSSPADGSTVESMEDGEFLFAVTGQPEQAVLYYRLYDNGVITDSRGKLSQTETKGVWSAYAMNMVYLADHTYTIVVKGYEDENSAYEDRDGVEVATFSFTGSGSAIEYNHDITATVNPAVGTISPEQSLFTFTFSAPVKISKGKILLPKTSTGAQDPIEFSPVATNPDAEGLASVWSVNIADAGYDMYKQTYLEMLLYGTDADGKLILNSSELGSASYYKFGEWYIDNGSDKVALSVSSPTPGPTYSLDKIVITLDGHTNIQTTWLAPAYLLDEDNIRYNLQSDFSNMDETQDWLVADGWTSLQPGNYTLVVEEGYYMVEQTEEYPERSSRELRANYTLLAIPEDEGCDLLVYTDEYYSRPASIPVEYFYGAFFKVEGASAYSIDDTAGTPVLEGTEAGIYFDREADGISMRTYYALYSGTLTLTIPEGYIVATLGGEPVGCKATTLTIVISGNVEPTITLQTSTSTKAVGCVAEVGFSFDGIEYSIPNLDELNINITGNGESKPTWTWNGANWNTTNLTPRYEAEYSGLWDNSSVTTGPAYVFPLTDNGTPVSEKGSYTVTVAEKSFLIYRPAPIPAPGMSHVAAAGEPEYNKAITFTFNVDPVLTAIDGIAVDAADVYTVYDINGCMVMKTSERSELHSLLPGFYIINGKKMLVK